MTEIEAATEVRAARGRGRPRPDFTRERDEEVFVQLGIRGAMGRQEMAEMLGVNVNLVYLSLVRLRSAGRVTKRRHGKFHVWAQVAES